MTTKNEIQMYFHCKKCILEIQQIAADSPEGASPRDYQRISAGFTKKGIQVWCNRHNANIIHIDFQGTKHPAV